MQDRKLLDISSAVMWAIVTGIPCIVRMNLLMSREKSIKSIIRVIVIIRRRRRRRRRNFYLTRVTLTVTKTPRASLEALGKT